MYSREKCERRVSQPRCGVSAPSFLDTLISNGNTRLGTPAIFRQNELIGNRASLPSANRKIDLARTPSRHGTTILLSSIDASTPMIRVLCPFFLSFFFFLFSFLFSEIHSSVEMCERNGVCQIDVRHIARILPIIVNTGTLVQTTRTNSPRFPRSL